jgi:sugar O-acyltransferase (sialic acid O-acetyltransferase NeuD family)
MDKENLLLVGSGGHAHSCIDVIEEHQQFQIVGLVDAAVNLGSQKLGYAVLGTDDDLMALSLKYKYAMVAVGQIKSASLRIELYEKIIAAGFQLPCIISPLAYVSKHATVGTGTIVMHGAIVNAGATIGKNCIINSKALVEHDACVGDHCHISTGAVLNGNVMVGEGSFVGSGSVIKHGVKLGNHSVIGMGSFIRHDQLNNLPPFS